jgi:hypothetical protein
MNNQDHDVCVILNDNDPPRKIQDPISDGLMIIRDDVAGGLCCISSFLPYFGTISERIQGNRMSKVKA